MSKIKVGINGFGRIGRLVFRAAQSRPDVQVVAINDLIDVDYIAYMLKYDSTHGRFDGTVEVKDGKLVVNGNEIRVSAEKNPADLKWGAVGADYVVESTGIFLTKETAQGHIDAGAKKVIMSAPSKDDTPMFVMGVNHEKYTSDMNFVSNASCTTNCLAPMVKLLDERFGIVKGFVSTVHSYTNDQNLHDAPHRDLRRARAAAYSIIPTTTHAAKAMEIVLPQLKGKIEASAMRVPVPDGSLTDLIVELERETTKEEINRVFLESSQKELKGIMEYTEDPIVSIDIIGNPHSCIFDAGLTSAKGNLVKIVGWYDNEAGYSNRLVDLVLK